MMRLSSLIRSRNLRDQSKDSLRNFYLIMGQKHKSQLLQEKPKANLALMRLSKNFKELLKESYRRNLDLDFN